MLFWLLLLLLLDPQPWPKGSYELGSALLSFHLSVFLFRSFFGIGSFVFSETQHGVRGPCVVVRGRVRFFGKNLFAQKMGFLKFVGKFSHYFFLNLVYNQSLYYFLYSCTNPIFGKNLFPEIWAKTLLANQITGYLNQL